MTKKKKKRRIRKEIRYAGIGILALAAVFLIWNIFTTNWSFVFEKSLNENAEKYSTKRCLIFYPKDSDQGKEKAENFCDVYEGEEDLILDYTVRLHGDYEYIDYEDIEGYVLKDGKDATFEAWNEELSVMISDYLRYYIRKDGKDINYKEMALDTYHPDLKKEDLDFKLKEDHLAVKHHKYDVVAKMPYGILQEEANMNFGYPKEAYKRPRYISKEQPLIAFTFDDGPNISTSSKIVETFYKYDGVATYFVLGNRLGPKQIDFIGESIELGNEYASHTQSHPNLTKISLEAAQEEILIPYYDLYNGLGYEMKLYRPPYGSYNSDVNSTVTLDPILWNIDSLDWQSRDANSIYYEVIPDVGDHKVALFHDIYSSTAEAMELLVPELVEKGYQFVTVSELIEHLNEDGLKATFMGRR